jgi:hypothetical protein
LVNRIHRIWNRVSRSIAVDNLNQTVVTTRHAVTLSYFQ